jgi:hypothetical protein
VVSNLNVLATTVTTSVSPGIVMSIVSWAALARLPRAVVGAVRVFMSLASRYCSLDFAVLDPWWAECGPPMACSCRALNVRSLVPACSEVKCCGWGGFS